MPDYDSPWKEALDVYFRGSVQYLSQFPPRQPREQLATTTPPETARQVVALTARE
jgi:hypothetical protein